MIINNLMGTVAAGSLLILNDPGGGGPTDDLEGDYPTSFVNPGAETSAMTDWTISSPGPSTATSATGVPGPRSGSRFFVGPTASSAEMTQRLAVPATLLSATDDGDAQFVVKWYAASTAGDDYSQAFVQFYDFDGNALGSEIVSDVPVAHEDLDWAIREWAFDVPVDARSVEAGFRMTLVGGSLINAYIDDIETFWVNGAATGFSLVNNMLWSESATVSGDSFDYAVSFPEPGTYIMAAITSSSNDAGEFPYMVGPVPADSGFKITKLVEAGNYVTALDAIQYYKVEVASGSEGSTDIGMQSYFGSFTRCYYALWLVDPATVDWNNLSTFTLLNDTTLSASFTPPENSAVLTVRTYDGAGSGAANLTGAGSNENVELSESTFYMAHWHLSPADGTEITVTDVQETTRAMTFGLILPPAITGTGRVSVSGSKTYVIVE